MSPIDKAVLTTVSGGMRWEHLPQSENVEDRRGWTREQNRRAPVRNLPMPMPQGGPFDKSIEDFVKRNRR
jgi:hypothetical protein